MRRAAARLSTSICGMSAPSIASHSATSGTSSSAGSAMGLAVLAEQMPVEQQHAVHLPGGGEGGKTRLFFRRAVQIADDHAVARREQLFLDAAQDLREEDVGQVRQGHQHHVALPRAQAARGRVRHIADLRHRRHDPRAGLRRNLAGAGERAADRRGGDRCQTGHLLDPRRALSAPDRLYAFVGCAWHRAERGPRAVLSSCGPAEWAR